MKMMRPILALLLASAVPAYAESDATSILDKINPAWQRLDALSADFLSDEQQKTVQELAFATAAGEICEGFAVDRQKFVSAFEIFSDEKSRALSAEERRQRERRLLVLYGIATGLFSAEGLLTKKDFCDAAESVRLKPAGRFWTP